MSQRTTSGRREDADTASAGTLLVELSRDDAGGWLAWSPQVEEYGSGATQEAAFHDLLVSLVEYREALRERRETLSERLASHLAFVERELTAT